VGWLACENAAMRQAINHVKGYLSVCNSQIDEAIAAQVLKHPDKLTQRNLSIILSNKKLLNNFNNIQGHEVDVIIPNVGCCVFARLCEDTLSAHDLVHLVAQKSGYLLFPADLFCTDLNAFRIGFGHVKFSDFIAKNNQ